VHLVVTLDPGIGARPEVVAREALQKHACGDVGDARVVAQARDLVAKVPADRDACPVGRPRQTETAAGQRDRPSALEQDVRRFVAALSVTVLSVTVLSVTVLSVTVLSGSVLRVAVLRVLAV